MAAGVIEIVVYPHDDIKRALVFDRYRDDNPLHAAIKVGIEVRRLEEFAGTFKNNVAAQIAPGDVPGVRSGAETERFVINSNGCVILDTKRSVPTAMNAVEFQKVRRRCRAALYLIEVD